MPQDDEITGSRKRKIPLQNVPPSKYQKYFQLPPEEFDRICELKSEEILLKMLKQHETLGNWFYGHLVVCGSERFLISDEKLLEHFSYALTYKFNELAWLIWESGRIKKCLANPDISIEQLEHILISAKGMEIFDNLAEEICSQERFQTAYVQRSAEALAQLLLSFIETRLFSDMLIKIDSIRALEIFLEKSTRIYGGIHCGDEIELAKRHLEKLNVASQSFQQRPMGYQGSYHAPAETVSESTDEFFWQAAWPRLFSPDRAVVIPAPHPPLPKEPPVPAPQSERVFTFEPQPPRRSGPF